MELIDTHTHLYLDEFRKDIVEIIERARAAGVARFYLPAIDSEEMPKLFKLVDSYPQLCFPMAALHPCSVKENYKEELSILSESLKKRSFAAIGETGLDFYWDKTFVKEQYECFNTQIEWGLQYNLPIVIHTRNAMRETIDVIKSYHGKGLTGIFHCFGGSIKEAEEIIDTGFMLGIGGVVTYKNSGLAEVLRCVDLKNIVLETDSPYLTPVPYRGKRNESSYLKIIAEKVAEVKNIPVEDVAKITTENARRVFR